MAEIKKILCAVDLSDISPKIADYARTLAELAGALVHVVYVAPSLSQYAGFHVPPSSIETFVGEIVEGAEQSMDNFVAEHFSGVSTQGHVTTGYAAEEVLKFAKENDCDLIVMGTHGRTGIDRILFGSVAEKVVKSAPIPVLTLRPEQQGTD
jgi:nucleotide-binding universal stress UspA family protein